jgi:hypothetical protein
MNQGWGILLVKLKLHIVQQQDSPPAGAEVSNHVKQNQTRQGDKTD